jgi:hypothetical protein
MQYNWSDEEKEILTVLNANQKNSSKLNKNMDSIQNNLVDSINSSEALLKELGYSLPNKKSQKTSKKSTETDKKKNLYIEDWESIYQKSVNEVGLNSDITDILTPEEISNVEQKLKQWNTDFNEINKLDKMDWAICSIAGILSAAIDILFVKMPKHSSKILKSESEGGSLSNWIKDSIKKSLPEDEIRKLEKNNWVPYDSASSRGLKEHVEGFYPKTHRLHSLGHDPILGFIFGVRDILNGTITTIDSTGKFVTQAVDIKDNSLIGMRLFDSIARQLGHLKSDIATPAGLPAPFMGLFQKLQFGDIGGHNIAEITRMMYMQGYDFSHFIAMSIPVAIIEVIVRISYIIKNLAEGKSLKDSLFLSKSDKHKLNTMLFISNTISVAANAGKVAFTQNPLSINYPQWISFFKYTLKELKYRLITKEIERQEYINNKLSSEWDKIDLELNNLISDYNLIYTF